MPGLSGLGMAAGVGAAVALFDGALAFDREGRRARRRVTVELLVALALVVAAALVG